MLKRPFLLGISLVVAAIGVLALPAFAQGQAASSTAPVTITVTVLGPTSSAPPPLTEGDLEVFAGKERLNVIGWDKAQGQNPASRLLLAIVIDNSDSAFGGGRQIDDLADFIEAQSKTAFVGLFYAINGTVKTVAPFSTDHDAVIKALRLPIESRAVDSSSVYLSLDSLVSHWPTAAPGRREVLLLASGTDHLYPGTEGLDIEPSSFPADPFRDAALRDAQEAGIMVHTVFLVERGSTKRIAVISLSVI